MIETEDEMGRKRFDRGGYYADRKENRASSKIDKMNAKANLALAKAQKRKMLVALIVVGLIAYAVISTGSASSIIEKMKSYL